MCIKYKNKLIIELNIGINIQLFMHLLILNITLNIRINWFFVTYPFSPTSRYWVRHLSVNQAYRNLSTIEAPPIPNPHWLNCAYCISNRVHEEKTHEESLCYNHPHCTAPAHIPIMVCPKTAFLCWFCVGSDHQGWALHRSWGRPGK